MSKFLSALTAAKARGTNIVIPDIKCVSPKEGDLLQGRDPVAVAKSLAAVGAPVLSVVTEPKNFGGSEELLSSVAKATGLPILRKDFFTTAEEIHRSKEIGASAVLLMYSCLPKEKLAELYQAARAIDLDVLVETHTPEDIAHARTLGVRLMGINNRDITVLERDNGDVSRTKALAGQKPADVFLISESSLMTPDDVRTAIAAGADAALIGTAIWQAADPAKFYRLLTQPIEVKLCGMMDEAGVTLCAHSGAEIIGFVVDYPEPVPWDIPQKKAAELIAHLRQENPAVKSCVVTGGSVDKISALAETVRPDIIQIHHRENLTDTLTIAARLHEQGIKVIRSLPAGSEKRQAQYGIADLKELAHRLAAGLKDDGSGIDYLLMDAREPGNASAKALAAPMEEFLRLREVSPIPVILAGGITPDNVQQLLRESNADRIDIMSGIETSPGSKSPELMQNLFNAIYSK